MKEKEMNFEDLKEAFHKRVPKCFPESFLIEKDKIVKLLDTIRSEVPQKYSDKIDEQPEEAVNLISTQREILYQALLSRNKTSITKEEAIKGMAKIIKTWNTTYHPTTSDYKKLAEQIFNFLQKENVIFYFKSSKG
jgi:hypothetical protein